MTNHLITTAITGSVHPRCGGPVLVGVAEGINARVDLTPLNQAGEIAALLAGLDTYTLTRGGLVYRDAGRIAGRSIKGPVLAQHDCRRTIPATHRATTAPPAPAAVADGCPY